MKRNRIIGWLLLSVALCHPMSRLLAQEKTSIDHTLWDQLLHKHVNSEGWVDYKGFEKDSLLFRTYLLEVSESAPNEKNTQEERLAYYINLYNAYTIALILREYPVQSIKDIKKPWTEKFIPIGNRMYSLNDIEHGILRNLGEPRIHFAINCASISCPKLLNEAYVPQKLEEQLKKVTIAFINGQENQLTGGSVKLSKIFKWYRSDFEVNGKRDLIGFINQYSHHRLNPNIDIAFREYNWQLNEK